VKKKNAGSSRKGVREWPPQQGEKKMGKGREDIYMFEINLRERDGPRKFKHRELVY